MKAKYVNCGKSVDIVPTKDIAAGEIVIRGNLIGIAHLDIPAGVLGSLSTEGIYNVEKSSGVTFEVGSFVYWNKNSGTATATETDTKIGVAVAAAASGDTSVTVKI